MEKGNCFFSTVLVALICLTFLATPIIPSVEAQAEPFWPVHGRDQGNTGYCPANISDNAPSLLWDIEPTGSYIRAGGAYFTATTPLIGANGTIFVASISGNITAVSPNGNIEWKMSLGGNNVLGPVLGPSGSLIVGIVPQAGGNHTTVFSISPNGHVEWSLNVTGSFPAFDVDPNGTIYATLYVYDQTALSDSGTVNTSVYAIAISQNGTVKWRIGIPENNILAPVLSADGILYILSERNLYAVNGNGTLRWSREIPDAPCGDRCQLLVTTDGGIEYLGNYSVHRYYPNGTMAWICNLTRSTYDFSDTPGAILYDSEAGMTYAIMSGYLTAIDDAGNVKWLSHLDYSSFCYAPVLSSNGRIVILTGLELLCYSTDNGTLIWNVDTNFTNSFSGDSGISIDGNGTVYFVMDVQRTQSLHLYAFNYAERNAGDNGAGALLAITLIGLSILVSSMILVMVLNRKK